MDWAGFNPLREKHSQEILPCVGVRKVNVPSTCLDLKIGVGPDGTGDSQVEFIGEKGHN